VPALEGRDLVVTGVVASLPQPARTACGFRFALDAESRRNEAGELPPLIVLGWYSGFTRTRPCRSRSASSRRTALALRAAAAPAARQPQPAWLRLRAAAVRARRARHRLRARRAAAATAREAAGFPVERLRQRVRDAIYAAVADRRAAGVLAALAVGDQGAIERDDWERFRNTGVAHLMSISGLHITMFAWLAGLGLGAVWRRSRRAVLALPAQSAARWGGLRRRRPMPSSPAGACRRSGRSGCCGRLPAAGRRAALAVALVLLAAATVVTLLDPWALTQPGFWLSFAAVGLLMASTMARPVAAAPVDDAVPERPGWLGRALAATGAGVRTQIVATLGLTPLTLVFFEQVSLVGLLANLWRFPWSRSG
jgi:competence protein ComEC